MQEPRAFEFFSKDAKTFCWGLFFVSFRVPQTSITAAPQSQGLGMPFHCTVSWCRFTLPYRFIVPCLSCRFTRTVSSCRFAVPFPRATLASLLVRGVLEGEAQRIEPGRRRSLRWDCSLNEGQNKPHRGDGTAQCDEESMEACSRRETGGGAKVRLPSTYQRAVCSKGATRPVYRPRLLQACLTLIPYGTTTLG